MQLRQVYVLWAGGAGQVLVTASNRGAVALGPGGASIPAELPGPFPVLVELTGRLAPPGIEVDSAAVEAEGLTVGGHVVVFEGADITRRLTLEPGTRAYGVSLAPNVIERFVPLLGPVLAVGVIGGLALSIFRPRKRELW